MTLTRPNTVPTMPMVGAKPPACMNGARMAPWRLRIASFSASSTAATRSGSVPSTTSWMPLRVNGSSISLTASSSASRPSRRAFSA